MFIYFIPSVDVSDKKDSEQNKNCKKHPQSE